MIYFRVFFNSSRLIAMNGSNDPDPIITEEPLPGWQRYEIEGQKPWFKTPAPRTVIRDAKKLQSFL